MTIPHSKILSPTVMSPKSNSTANTHVNTEVNITLQHLGKRKDETSTNDTMNDTDVKYPPPTDELKIDDVNVVERDIPNIEPNDSTGVDELKDSVEFLKLIIDAHKNNVIHYNNYIVLTDENLCNLIQTILHADEINITYDEDFDAYCCVLSSKFSKIDNIYIKKNDVSYNLKYDYNDVYSIIEAYSISVKFVCKS